MTAIVSRDYFLPPRSFTTQLPSPTALIFGQQMFRPVAMDVDAVITWGIADLKDLHGYPRPVIHVCHGNCQWSTQTYDHLAGIATHTVAVSKQAAQALPPTANPTILYNGIEPYRCTPTMEREESRKLLGIKPEDRIIGHVGRIALEKNPLAAVFAAKFLGPPWRALLIGGGWNPDPIIRQAIAHDPRTLVRPPLIQVGDVYDAIDVFMLVTPAEGLSLAWLEACYAGVPTVTSPAVHAELEALHGTMSQFVFANAHPHTLALATVASTMEAKRPVVEHAHRVVQDHYLAQHMATRWMNYLDDVFDGKALRSSPSKGLHAPKTPTASPCACKAPTS